MLQHFRSNFLADATEPADAKIDSKAAEIAMIFQSLAWTSEGLTGFLATFLPQ
jgi:hypothetical protein